MFGRLSALVDELGGTATALYLIDRLFGRFGNFIRLTPCLILAQPVPDKPLLRPGRGASVAVDRIEALGEGFAGMPMDETDLARRQAADAIGFAARKDGTVLGYQWLSLDAHDDELFCCRFEIEPMHSGAFDFDIFIRPEHRSSLAFVRLWDTAFAFLREHGVRWTFSYVSRFNPASVAAHRRLGGIETGRALFLRFGSTEVIMTNWRPWFHYAGGTRRPVIRLRAPNSATTGN
jgi:GNAT superfamily N-acetyltransferase